MISRTVSSLIVVALLSLATGLTVQAQVLDQIIFGNTASESSNGFSGTRVSAPTNNPMTGDPFRYIFPHTNLTLKVLSTIISTPTNLVVSVSGGTLKLQWPADHLGWLLQSNAVKLANSNFWFDLTNSAGTNVWSISINAASSNVYYRLRYPFP